MTLKEKKPLNSKRDENNTEKSFLKQLLVLINPESINVMLIQQSIVASARLEQLNQITIVDYLGLNDN